MKKLLHELLREAAWEDGGMCILLIDDGDDEIVLTKNEALYLADEIERDYIPRPRYEDGTPAKDEDFPVGSFFKVWLDGSWVLDICGEMAQQGMVDEPVKRYKPRIYDANGVEYEEGQKVWSIKYGTWFYVEKVRDNGRLNLSQHGLGEAVFNADPMEYIHKEPDSPDAIYGMTAQQCSESLSKLLSAANEAANQLSALIEKGA